MSAPLAAEWPKDIVIGVPAEEQLSSQALPPIISAQELLLHPPQKPPEIVEGLLHQGSKMVVGGASKTNKTWVLTDLAISVATGATWWGFQTKQGRVLYLNFELGDAFFADRIKSVSSAKDVDPGKTLDVWNLRGYAADFERLEPEIIRVAGREYALICLDPTYKLLGGRDENRAGDIASLLNGFERLAVETGAAIAFGAHFSKGNQALKESIDRIGGSGVFARDPDTILTMTRHEQDGAFTVEPILRNHAPISPFVICWNFPLMKRDDDLDPDKLRQANAGRKAKYGVQNLVDLLAKSKCGKQVGRIKATTAFQKLVCGETGMSRTKFYDLLKEGEQQGLLQRYRDGWQLVQKVQEVQPDARTDQ
jgi:hypothetical protein